MSEQNPRRKPLPKPEFGKPPKQQNDQSYLFPDGEDLPLISGTPQQVEDSPYIPIDRSWKQAVLPDMPAIDYDAVLAKDQELRQPKHRQLQGEVGNLFSKEWQSENTTPVAQAPVVRVDHTEVHQREIAQQSRWDVVAIAELLRPERGEVTIDTDLGQGMRLYLGEQTRTYFELYPNANVTRVTNQHMELVLYRLDPPSLTTDGVIFEQVLLGLRRRLSISASHEIKLLHEQIGPEQLVSQKAIQPSPTLTQEVRIEEEGNPHRSVGSSAEEQELRLHEALAPYLDINQLRYLFANRSQNLHEALRANDSPQTVLAILDTLSAILRPTQREQIKSPRDLAALLVVEMAHLTQEHLRVVCLNTKYYVQSIHTVYQGNIDTTVIRIAEVFREAIRLNSAAIITVHNHPSSDPSPSPDDVLVTTQLVAAGKLLDIDVLDHLIIGQGKWVSLREKGLGFTS